MIPCRVGLICLVFARNAGRRPPIANPNGGAWNSPCDVALIWADGDDAVTVNFHRPLDRMASNLQWGKDHGAVERKRPRGKVIWSSELGVREKSVAPQDCLRVAQKLEGGFPELVPFVFWSDGGFSKVVANLNGRELMTHPEIVTLSNLTQ